MNIYKIIKGSIKNFPYSIVCRETTISTHSSKTEALKYRAIYYNGDRGNKKMKKQIENQVHEAFEDFNKWETYGLVFRLLDERKITLRKIIEIAQQYGISKGVIKMRRRDLINHEAAVTYSNRGK